VSKRYSVQMSRFAEKQLKRLPKFIREAVFIWAQAVEEEGLPMVRKLPGYHDEPLKGKREGERSVRLNRAYRLIYVESEGAVVTLVTVTEVNKHEY
jgi:toxin HigB-1